MPPRRSGRQARRFVIGGAITAGLLAGGVGVAMAATSSSSPSPAPSGPASTSPYSGSSGSSGSTTPTHHRCPNMGNGSGGSRRGGYGNGGASNRAYMN